MVVLGIDPGYGITGFGIVEAQRGQCRLVQIVKEYGNDQNRQSDPGSPDLPGRTGGISGLIGESDFGIIFFHVVHL